MITNRYVKFAIIDNQPLFCEGLRMLLEREKGYSVSFCVNSRKSALEYLEKNIVNFIILDLNLIDSEGMALLSDIRIRYKGIPVLVISMHNENYYRPRVLSAGANGYIMKTESAQIILASIKTILNGNCIVKYKQKDLRFKDIEKLTSREFEIFTNISKGYGTSEIANNLMVSVKTIETHKEHIKTKLLLSSAKELLKYAIEFHQVVDFAC